MKNENVWRIRVGLTEEQEKLLERWYAVPADFDLDRLPPIIKREHIKLIESNSALSQRQIRSGEWKRKNSVLLKKAKGNDEKAFLELVSRDPQFLCSDLGLFFVSKWQSEMNGLYTLRLFNRDIAKGKVHPGQRFIERISPMLMKPFDMRGKNPNPPKEQVKICYYAALILFSGLKRLSKPYVDNERVLWVDRLRQKIDQVSETDINFDTSEGFFKYIQDTNRLVVDRWTNEFSSLIIVTSTPGVLASRLVSKVFNIQERKMRDVLKSRVVITWRAKDKITGVPKPNLRLESYSPFSKLLGTK